MKSMERYRALLGKKVVRVVLAVIAAVVLLLIFNGNSTSEIDTSDDKKPVVTLSSSVEYAGAQSVSLIGNVRAFTEAIVTSESAGRVTSVGVTLGQKVYAGGVIATLENASERASVLQAEGVYDAAVAASAQSGVGVDEANNLLNLARNNTISTLNAAMNTTNGIVISNIDQFFSNPNSAIPGLRVGGQGYTTTLNKERVAYQDLLPEWQSRVNILTSESDLIDEISYAKKNVLRTIDLIDIFLFIFDKKGDDNYNTTEVEFINLRTSLNSVISSLDATKTQLLSAEDSVKRAGLSASGSSASAADAQVKQALGSLRAAQANLSKTILRAPVSGTVNSLSVRTGDFITSFQEVAIVANNNALEVIAYMSDNERDLLQVGDEVSIEGAYPGRVTHISPAVNPTTRKIEVRIATEGEGITNGDTVRVTKEVDTKENVPTTVQVPLTAVKFEREDGSVFIVIDGVLVSKPVNIGKVVGSSVEITDGLESDEQFVFDARGLIAGDEVEVKN